MGILFYIFGIGYDKDGYDRLGFNSEGINRLGLDKNGFDPRTNHHMDSTKIVIDSSANTFHEVVKNEKEIQSANIEVDSKDRFDKDGYDCDGFDCKGFDRLGYSKQGYDKNGFNRQGVNRKGFSRDGFDKEGYDKSGFNRDGYNRQGLNRAGWYSTKYDMSRYDAQGYDSDGYNSLGYNRDGYNRNGFDKDGYSRSGFDKDGYNRQGLDRRGRKSTPFYAEVEAKKKQQGLNAFIKRDRNAIETAKTNTTIAPTIMNTNRSEAVRNTDEHKGFEKEGYKRKDQNRGGVKESNSAFKERSSRVNSANEYGYKHLDKADDFFVNPKVSLNREQNQQIEEIKKTIPIKTLNVNIDEIPFGIGQVFYCKYRGPVQVVEFFRNGFFVLNSQKKITYQSYQDIGRILFLKKKNVLLDFKDLKHYTR